MTGLPYWNHHFFSKASQLFGLLPPPKKGLRGLNRRAKHSIQLVLEKYNLLSQINMCNNVTIKFQLQSLLDIVRARLENLRRWEKNRKRRWKIKQAYQSYKKNPFEAGKQVLDPKCDTKFNCERSFLDLLKSNVFSDPYHQIPLPTLEGLPPPPFPAFEFDYSNLKSDDFFFLLSLRHNGSSPDVNGIPYEIYKICPKIRSYLI